MPELPEIALTAEILNARLKNKIIESFEFITGRFGPGRTKPDGHKKFINSLPLQIKKVNSKGKFLWFYLVDPENPENYWYIWNTFGLTGAWSFVDDDHDRLVVTFKDSSIIAHYSDMRNFGTFKFSQNQDDLKEKIKTLSPDFLKDENFDISKVTKYKQPIVAILMDQKKIGSGIGNYLAAEILYRARISPHRPGNSLTENDIANLTYYIKYMVKLCYLDGGTEYMGHLEKYVNRLPRKNYHPDIKILKKDKKILFSVYQQDHDPYGNPVKRDKIIKGRTTYWVPALQK